MLPGIAKCLTFDDSLSHDIVYSIFVDSLQCLALLLEGKQIPFWQLIRWPGILLGNFRNIVCFFYSVVHMLNAVPPRESCCQLGMLPMANISSSYRIF